ncbi:MAG: hypothetical protein EG822_04030 [Deltaproteobacteria bacterium]|nr:hypothetical protein [Deltaproteobacteria bacterium]TLN03229.1 MAG: hypothetical protein FDZ73_08685 [bacterium]
MKPVIPKVSDKLRLLLVLGTLFCLTLFASSSLFPPGFFTSHEGTNPIQRALAITYEIKNGFYYPRWLSLSYYGMGSPFTNFYSPGFYLSAAYLHIMGVPLLTSIKLVCGSLFFIGALGMFLWTRRFYSPSGAMLSSVLYLLAPYHFVNIYVRGALSEFSALAFLPFLFLGIDLSFTKSDKLAGNFLVALSSATILFFHHLSALLITPFAALYFLFRAFHMRAGLATTLQSMFGVILGAGLSAFYWLPAIFERRYLKWFEEALTTGYYSYSNHFVHVWQLISTYWGFGGSNPGPSDGMSFQIGLIILIVSIVALFSLLHTKSGHRWHPTVLLFLSVFALFLTTKSSSWLYSLFPWFSFIQFPWRFLGPATLFLSAFAGLTANDSDTTHSVIKVPPGVTVAFVILLSLLFSAKYTAVGSHQTFLEKLNTSQAEKRIFNNRSLGNLCEKDEYLPRWVSDRILVSDQSSFQDPVVAGTRVENVLITGAQISFSALSDNDNSSLTIPWFFFPGWQAQINGKYVYVGPDRNGFLTFDIPKGRHSVVVRFGTTVVRTIAWYITLATILVAITLALLCIFKAEKIKN